MTTQTFIISTKAGCVVTRSMMLALTAGLAQWADSDTKPGTIAIIVIAATVLLNGASALSDFLSTAFSQYLSNGSKTTKPELSSSGVPIK